MNLKLEFEICQTECCDELQFCDTTCEHDPLDISACCDGYGEGGNPSRRDIAYTRFNFKLPNGTVFTNIDKGWKPGTRPFGSFQVTGGTAGVVVVDINAVVLGTAIWTSTNEFTATLIVQDINAASSSTGWRAYIDPLSADTVIIESVTNGIAGNGLPINVSVSGDVTVAMIIDPTQGGGDGGDCVCFTLPDLYGQENCPAFPNWPDGVYTITYILYDSSDQEIARKTIEILLDCNTRNCIRDIVLASAEGKCQCDQDKLDQRIIKLRTKLEQAHIQMEECLYDCANETIKSACKMCESICLDC